MKKVNKSVCRKKLQSACKVAHLAFQKSLCPGLAPFNEKKETARKWLSDFLATRVMLRSRRSAFLYEIIPGGNFICFLACCLNSFFDSLELDFKSMICLILGI